jgi:raffinose/stachyose/melibiose transport system substrate-binding protein
MMLAGCQKKEALKSSADASRKVKISVWHSFVGSDQRAEFMTRRMAEFQAANPDIVVDEQKIPRDQYQTRLKTLAAANELPDGFLLWPNAMTFEFASSGLLADINDYLNQEAAWKEGMLPLALNEFTYQGKTYGAGLGISLTSIVFYNKALFDKYNLKVPTTYQELKTAIEVFNQNSIIPIAHGNKPQWPAQSSLYSIIANRVTGSQWLTDTLAKQNGAKFTDQVFVDALSIMKDLADSSAFNRDYNSIDNVQMRSYFYRGEAAMMIDGSWALPDVIANAPDELKEHIEMTVFPAIPGGKGDPTTISGVSSTSIVINAKANPAQKEALCKLIKFITEDAAQTMYMDYNIPVSSLTVEADLSKVTSLYAKMVTLIKEHPLVTVYDSALNSEQAEIINNGLQAVMLGVQTPEALAAQLAKTVQ